ncbi:hypothetical protein CHS0354_000561 [Potamilus streckersoni]|uniref:Uncharacterized protein n=1 Tax=Potamilus streckersoni TaxID=2493646 RepID=A0AAE0T825_9BIVA|nr:hypothetical protein CHS0354_000561 [Potamilus streckersoni]
MAVDVRVLSGTIRSSITLSADTSYFIIGNLIIPRGIEMNVSPGTTIYCDYSTSAKIIVLNGGSIVARGSISKPIVFTSSRSLKLGGNYTKSVQDKQPGDWGGIFIHGVAQNNLGNNISSDIDIATHGGSNLLGATFDPSTLEYVRIEYAGAEIGNSVSLPGLGLYSVPSNCNISNIQVHMCKGDGFLFSGGTVNAKYLVATGNQGHGFKLSNSWIGKGQYWVGVQGSNSKSLIYIYNNMTNSTASSTIAGIKYYTQPTIYNTTLIGNSSNISNHFTSNYGVYISNEGQASFYRSIIYNFKLLSVAIETKTRINYTSKKIFFESSYFKSETNRQLTSYVGIVNELNTFSIEEVLPQWDIKSTDDLDFATLDESIPLNGKPIDLQVLNKNMILSTSKYDPVETPLRYPNETSTFFDQISQSYMGALFDSNCCNGGIIYDSTVSGELIYLSGDVYTTRTLSSDTTYKLVGNYIIHNNATLFIEAGTKILADYETKATLIVLKGAKAYFNGTKDLPIVFTSEKSVAFRKPGDWGGLLILGDAPNNIGNNILSDANIGNYGGTNALDDSGTMEYVRVEFAGSNLGNDTRLAGIGLYSLGASTNLSHLQAHLCASDGFRFIGGTVNARYLLSTGNTDDGFEISNSWIGKGQFWICIQNKFAGNHGIEVIGNKIYPENRVQIGANIYYTRPTIFNATLIGKGQKDSDGILDEIDAVSCSGNAQGIFRNFVIANFYGLAISIDKESVKQLNQTNFPQSNIQLTNSAIYVKSDQTVLGSKDYGAIWSPTSPRDKRAFLYTAELKNLVTNPLLKNINFNNPLSGEPLDIRPDTMEISSPLVNPEITFSPKDPPSRYPGEQLDFFNTTAKFVGAVSPNDRWLFNKWAVWYSR